VVLERISQGRAFLETVGAAHHRSPHFAVAELVCRSVGDAGDRPTEAVRR
jgi:hypothetical protein